MKTQQELCDILGFIAEYATYQLGSGVHTSRVIRNAQRIGEALGVDVQLSSFQKSTILTVLDTVSGESATRVVAIPSLPISFERNSDLSALSWDALDEGLSLDEIRSRYRTLVDKPRMDPIFTLVVVGLANASFCKLFGGDWTAVDISTLLAGAGPRIPHNDLARHALFGGGLHHRTDARLLGAGQYRAGDVPLPLGTHRSVESLLLRHPRRLPAGVQHHTCTLHLLSGVCPKQRRPADETLGPCARCVAHYAVPGHRHLLYFHVIAPA